MPTAAVECELESGYIASVDPGISIAFEPDSTFIVSYGAVLNLIGTSGNEITVTHESTGTYGFTIDGTIAAEWTVFEYMDGSGINVTAIGSLDPVHSFNHCTFQHGSSGGRLLTMDNAQDFRAGYLGAISGTVWGAGSTYNAAKFHSNGYLQFTDYSGTLAGESNDQDPYNRIFWGNSTPTSTPTGTPPTVTPTPTGNPPTNTPTPTSYTNTPTPTTGLPTDTPVPPTATIPPTATNTPGCSVLGCTVFMPSDDFAAGDPCYCNVTVCNTQSVTLTDVPVFVILDVYGMLFFAPTFTEFNFYSDPILPGETVISVLPNFSWPAGAGTATNIRWYAAMTDPGMTTLYGDLGTFTFGWH